MITNAILIMFYGLLKNVFLAPILRLQNVSLTTGIPGALDTAGQYLSNINAFFPVDVLLICSGVILLLESFILIWKASMWVVHLVRGSG